MAYSLKNALNQNPETLKNTALAVLGVGLAIRGWDPSLLETIGVGLALEKVLTVFYVAPIRQAQDEEKALLAFENVRLKSQRPLRAPQPEPE
jgi:hypothetical protein